MTNTPFNRELSRWIFAAGGVIVTFFVMFYCAAFILLFGNMLPRALSALLAGFPLGLLVVLAGSLLAPRYPLKVAFSLWVLCAVPATSVFGFQFFSYGWLSTIDLIGNSRKPCYIRLSVIIKKSAGVLAVQGVEGIFTLLLPIKSNSWWRSSRCLYCLVH